MTKLLHIEASPRGGRSRSTALGGALIDRLFAHDPSLVLDHLDLWREPLPDLDGALLDAKYARLAGRALGEGEGRAWDQIGAMVQRLATARAVVITTPMWNFGIPYRLKHYIDLVTQPGLSFTFDPTTGYSPLLAPRPVYVLLASAGDYRFGPSRGRPDLATPYLATAFSFIGLTGAVFIPVGPTIGSEAETEAGVERARERIASLRLA